MSIDESKPGAEPPSTALSAGAGLGPINCEPSLEDMYRYMDGQLDAERQAKISTHLRQCGGCDDIFHFQSGLRQLLGQRCRADLPDDLPRRVFGAITDLP